MNYFLHAIGLSKEASEAYMHIAMALFVLAIITGLAIYTRVKLRNVEEGLVPAGKLTVVNFFEVVVQSLLSIMEDLMGPKARKHLPLIGTIFIFILFSNLMEVIPTMIPPTENINTNLACAVVIFLYYNFVGIRENGIKNYLKHMMGPVIWIGPLVFCIEMISHFIRPVSLSVRLFGNMTGDGIMLQLFSNMTPILVPVIFLMLAIFVAIIQAFVFTLLSIIYIALAQAAEEH